MKFFAASPLRPYYWAIDKLTGPERLTEVGKEAPINAFLGGGAAPESSARGTRRQTARAAQGRAQFECASLAQPEEEPPRGPTYGNAPRRQCGPGWRGQAAASGTGPSDHRASQNLPTWWWSGAGPRATSPCRV